MDAANTHKGDCQIIASSLSSTVVISNIAII